MDVGRRCYQCAAQNAALAVAVVKHFAGIKHQGVIGAMLEGGMGGKTVGVTQQFGQIHGGENTLLASIHLLWELADIGKDVMHHTGHKIFSGHAVPVGGAEHDVMFDLHGAHITSAELTTGSFTEQAVSIKCGPRWGDRTGGVLKICHSTYRHLTSEACGEYIIAI